VCQGAGSKRLFEELGATIVVEGGQTMNPSAAEIVAAIDAVPAPEVIVLPNNSNVLLAAEQASALSAKEVRVLSSHSVQAGLAAMVPFLTTSPVDDNERVMLEALDSVATGEVAIASRAAELDGLEIRAGAYLGLVDGTAVAVGDELHPVALAVVEKLLEGERGWLGILTGDDAPPLDGIVAAVHDAHPDLEVEVNEGGQPHYPLLLAAE
jgi:dihydroxyacetone kinase-like predicted kinase